MELYEIRNFGHSAILGSQSAMAANLRYMKFDGKVTYRSDKDQKIQIISASNVGGTTLVNIAAIGSMCQVFVASLTEAAAVVAAVSENTTVECYTREPVQFNLGANGNLVQTKEIMIIKGAQ